MEKSYVLNQKLIKRKLLELARTKRKLELQRALNINEMRKALKPKLESDILNLKTIREEYGFSSKTIYRYRAKGLKFGKNSLRGFVYIVRKDLEDFIKRNIYD